MRLSSTVKAIVGVLTGIVVLVPIGLFLVWLTFMFGMKSGSSAESFFPLLDSAFSLIFLLMCGLNLLIYGMTAFYVTHAVKNVAATYLLRIIGILLVVFIPYLGMPAYYVLYILISNPPGWALKPQPAAHEANGIPAA